MRLYKLWDDSHTVLISFFQITFYLPNSRSHFPVFSDHLLQRSVLQTVEPVVLRGQWIARHAQVQLHR